MGYGLAHYTWGLLLEPAEACMQHVAPPDWADVALILSTILHTPISTANHYS